MTVTRSVSEGERFTTLSQEIDHVKRSPSLTLFEVALLRFNPEGFQRLAGG